jgi:uncharacterized protein YjiK
MMAARIALLAALAGAACAPGGGGNADSVELAAREARLEARLAAGSDTAVNLATPVARWILPPDLGEISGLALTADGRVLAHNDERTTVTVIDPRRGAILKRFVVGHAEMHADLEGITVAGEHIYMVTSNGRLYGFHEGGGATSVPYSMVDTQLGRECEFEGVAFDSTAQALVLACKNVGTKALKDHLVLYRWSLDAHGPANVSTISVPLAQVVRGHDWKELHPSDITVDPSTGNYVIVAAQERALIELTPTGTVVRTLSLPQNHVQTEGVAITPDGLLIVSDEAKTGPATITLYRWRQAPASTMGST